MATLFAAGGPWNIASAREKPTMEMVPGGGGPADRQIPRQILQAQKMEAIGHLAGGLAHDLNNHLLVIRGCIELCHLENPEDSVTGHLLRQARMATDRAVDLTRQILLFTRQQPQDRVVLDLNASLREIHDMLHRVMGENISLVLELSDDLWPVRADPTNVDQVITNLLINARDAMPQGGTVTLRTDNVSPDQTPDGPAPHSQQVPWVRLSVSDTGTGIPEEVMPHIFDPFFTTKPNGTGLGLSVVHGIVVAHDGWIAVRSTPGKGTTFEVYLPAATVEASTARGVDSEPLLRSAPRGRGESILLIEDDPAVRSLTEAVLRNAGYAVHSCGSLREALDVSEKLGGRVDLIISDVVLPDGSGRDFAQRFAANHPMTAVLLVSGYPDGGGSPVAGTGPFWRFVQKPYTFAGLLGQAGELLRRVAQART